MNGTLSFYGCRFSGGDTMRWWAHSIAALKNLFESFALTGSRYAHSIACAHRTW